MIWLNIDSSHHFVFQVPWPTSTSQHTMNRLQLTTVYSLIFRLDRGPISGELNMWLSWPHLIPGCNPRVYIEVFLPSATNRDPIHLKELTILMLTPSLLTVGHSSCCWCFSPPHLIPCFKVLIYFFLMVFWLVDLYPACGDTRQISHVTSCHICVPNCDYIVHVGFRTPWLCVSWRILTRGPRSHTPSGSRVICFCIF